jgi:tripartite-type tricarboxylate transporter receptor subunit TctC
LGKIGDATLILVAHPSFPARTVQELVAYSKTQPAGVAYGTSGVGGTPHIAGELLKLRTGANLTHIPYKGGGQAMSDALGGNVPLVFTAVAGAMQHLQQKRLVAIAVSSEKRSPSLPDVPTFIEGGVPDFEATSWVALLAPPKTPRAVVDKLNRELNAVLRDPVTVDKLATLGIVTTPGTPELLTAQMRADLAKYGQVVKAANIKAE